jgi:hypothetical protein
VHSGHSRWHTETHHFWGLNFELKSNQIKRSFTSFWEDAVEDEANFTQFDNEDEDGSLGYLDVINSPEGAESATALTAEDARMLL